MQYVLVGGPFEIMDTPHKVEVWGQPVEIPEDLARGAICHGALLLPKEEFDGLGFTEKELQFTNARVQIGAPPEFHRKLEGAIQAARDYRAKLMAPPAEPPASANPTQFPTITVEKAHEVIE